MSNPARANTTMVALAAALLVPRVQRVTGVVLTIDDVAMLMGLTVAAWHAACAVVERYFPPPTQLVGKTDIHPTLPENPAQETK